MIDKVVKAQEFIYMSIENIFERIAVALETLAGNGSAPNTNGDKKPARAPRAGKSEATQDAPPVDPPVNQAPPAAPANEVDPEPVRMAAAEFINSAPPDKQAEAQELIKTKIWPALGVTRLAELPPSKFDAAIAEFKKGYSAFAPAPAAAMDI